MDCALAFLALCKAWFVLGLCVPCNVLKIALATWKSLGCLNVYGMLNRCATGRACCCAGIHCSSSPELKPNKITDDEDKNKSSIELRLTELLLIANKKMRIYSSASIAANPMLCVRHSLLSVNSKFFVHCIPFFSKFNHF